MHKYQYIYSSHRTRRQGEYLDFWILGFFPVQNDQSWERHFPLSICFSGPKDLFLLPCMCECAPRGFQRRWLSWEQQLHAQLSINNTLPLQTSLSPCTRWGKTICTLPYMLGPLGFTQAVQGSSPMAGRIFPAVKAFTSTAFYVSGLVWRQPTLNAPW